MSYYWYLFDSYIINFKHKYIKQNKTISTYYYLKLILITLKQNCIINEMVYPHPFFCLDTNLF